MVFAHLLIVFRKDVGGDDAAEEKPAKSSHRGCVHWLKINTKHYTIDLNHTPSVTNWLKIQVLMWLSMTKAAHVPALYIHTHGKKRNESKLTCHRYLPFLSQ